MKHIFEFEPDEKNMMCGFTPFCLQKMDKVSVINLKKGRTNIFTNIHIFQWSYKMWLCTSPMHSN